jgi:hypothetical protein
VKVPVVVCASRGSEDGNSDEMELAEKGTRSAHVHVHVHVDDGDDEVERMDVQMNDSGYDYDRCYCDTAAAVAAHSHSSTRRPPLTPVVAAETAPVEPSSWLSSWTSSWLHQLPQNESYDRSWFLFR